jgi:predicted nucleic acid-binding protein
VSNPYRFGEVPLIADTSVWAKLSQASPDLLDDFRAAGREGLIVTSTIVQLEYLHDARTGEEFDIRDAVFSRARTLPITRAVSDAALSALRDLRAKGGPGYHRVGVADALIAATAQENSVNVLHDNRRHFAKLAEVLEFEPVSFFASAEHSSER